MSRGYWQVVAGRVRGVMVGGTGMGSYCYGGSDKDRGQ